MCCSILGIMSSKSPIVNFVSKVWGNRIFLTLLVFNILCNSTAIAVYHDAWSIFMILCISALAATIESLICRMFGNKTLRKCVLGVLLFLHLWIAIVDIFLIANFNLIFTHDSIGIMAETTAEEIRSFFATYLTIPNILMLLGVILFVIGAAIWIARKLVGNKVMAFISMILAVLGASIYLFMIYNHTANGEGGASVSQLHSFTRTGYAFMRARSTYQNIQHMREVNRGVNASLKQEDAPTVIVIIGESFSRYHSSLYGYSKPTNPLLTTRANDSTLVVFDNVVSGSDHTGVVLKNVFRTIGSSEPNANEVLFPALFKKAGYKTALLDNQYFVNKGFSWITDGGLSDLMFDYRNPETVGHDINLIPLIPDFADPQMILLHLFGQHFTYDTRYPQDFKHFKAADYSNDLNEEEREVIAHYDNATLYNDFIVDSIIKKYEDKNCLVIYFSDHGEEIYEIDDFMGHGNAAQRPTIDYQIKVPFMIWASNSFQAKYPDIVARIKASKHKPIITDDFPHFLFDAAGIETKYFCPELSFINDKYQTSKPRIVLGDIDYDKYRPDPGFKPRY